MEALFTSGRIVDLILVLVAIEALALLAWRGRTGRGPSAVSLLANLLSGAALMFALRAALTGAHWTTIAACLAASLICHLADLLPRLREAARPPREGGREGIARWSRPPPLETPVGRVCAFERSG